MMIELEYNPFERVVGAEPRAGVFLIYLFGGAAAFLLFFVLWWLFFRARKSESASPPIVAESEQNRWQGLGGGVNFLPDGDKILVF